MKKDGGQRVRVTFVNGETKEYEGVSAALVDQVFVIYVRPGRKLESRQAWPAEQVAMATLPDGSVVLGTGKVKRN